MSCCLYRPDLQGVYIGDHRINSKFDVTEADARLLFSWTKERIWGETDSTLPVDVIELPSVVTNIEESFKAHVIVNQRSAFKQCRKKTRYSILGKGIEKIFEFRICQQSPDLLNNINN